MGFVNDLRRRLHGTHHSHGRSAHVKYAAVSAIGCTVIGIGLWVAWTRSLDLVQDVLIAALCALGGCLVAVGYKHWHARQHRTASPLLTSAPAAPAAPAPTPPTAPAPAGSAYGQG